MRREARATPPSAFQRSPTRGWTSSRRFSIRRRPCPRRSSSRISSRRDARGAAALVDVAGYKNADALVHVVRAFRDPAVPHPSGSVDPARDAQAMEDELILADLGVVERRLERMEKDLKKNKSPELDKEKELLLTLQDRARERPAAARARPGRRGSAAAARLPAAVGEAAARRDQSRRGRRRRGRQRREGRRADGHDRVPLARGHPRGPALREDRARDLPRSTRPMPRRS